MKSEPEKQIENIIKLLGVKEFLRILKIMGYEIVDKKKFNKKLLEIKRKKLRKVTTAGQWHSSIENFSRKIN